MATNLGVCWGWAWEAVGGEEQHTWMHVHFVPGPGLTRLPIPTKTSLLLQVKLTSFSSELL